MGWTIVDKKKSLFSSSIFWSFFLTHLSNNSLVIHAFQFAIYSTGRVLIPLKHRGLLNFPRTNGFIFSLPSMLQHIITVTLSLLFYPRRNTFHPWMLEFCSAEACKTGSFHRRSKYFSARNQWLNWVIFRSIFEHNLIQHSHFCKLYSGAVWISR